MAKEKGVKKLSLIVREKDVKRILCDQRNEQKLNQKVIKDGVKKAFLKFTKERKECASKIALGKKKKQTLEELVVREILKDKRISVEGKISLAMKGENLCSMSTPKRSKDPKLSVLQSDVTLDKLIDFMNEINNNPFTLESLHKDFNKHKGRALVKGVAAGEMVKKTPTKVQIEGRIVKKLIEEISVQHKKELGQVRRSTDRAVRCFMKKGKKISGQLLEFMAHEVFRNKRINSGLKMELVKECVKACSAPTPSVKSSISKRRLKVEKPKEKTRMSDKVTLKKLSSDLAVSKKIHQMKMAKQVENAVARCHQKMKAKKKAK